MLCGVRAVTGMLGVPVCSCRAVPCTPRTRACVRACALGSGGGGEGMALRVWGWQVPLGFVDKPADEDEEKEQDDALLLGGSSSAQTQKDEKALFQVRQSRL